MLLAAIQPALAAALGLLLAAAVATSVYWSVAAWHALRVVFSLPTAADGLTLRLDNPKPTCLIVPAHNEQDSIGPLIESLKLQDHPQARFVLALDRCTDNTAAIARRHIGDDPRFQILEITSCPGDWAGKVHAAWHAIQHAHAARDAELLAFTDADCVFEPGCLRACQALMEQRGAALLTLLSTLSSRSWFEIIAQPAATLELIRQYPIARVNRTADKGRRSFANGQFMMFRADAYHAVGGHAAVKDALLEDLALARLIHQSNLDNQISMLLADGVVRCRMYDTWQQFRTGWKRIYIEAVRRRSDRLRTAAWRARMTGVVMPLSSAACLILASALDVGNDPLRTAAIFIAAFGLAAWLFTTVLIARAGHAQLWAAPLQVVGSWLVGNILAEAAEDLRSGTPTRWGGREYILEDRAP